MARTYANSLSHSLLQHVSIIIKKVIIGALKIDPRRNLATGGVRVSEYKELPTRTLGLLPTTRWASLRFPAAPAGTDTVTSPQFHPVWYLFNEDTKLSVRYFLLIRAVKFVAPRNSPSSKVRAIAIPSQRPPAAPAGTDTVTSPQYHPVRYLFKEQERESAIHPAKVALGTIFD